MRFGTEVQHAQHGGTVLRFADEREDALLVVVRVDPVKAVPAVVDLPERFFRAVNMVQLADEGLHARVRRVLQKEPFKLFVIAPFDELRELVAHKAEHPAGMTRRIQRQQPRARKLPPPVARHPPDERALAVHDLVVAEREDIVLAEGVHHRERQKAVIVFAAVKVDGHIPERVVHPAHVPFIMEAEPALLRRIRHERPRRALLGIRRRAGDALADDGVERLQKRHRREILLAAALVILFPRGIVHAEIQVEHAAHAVHAQRVGVVLFQPEERRAYEERAHLIARVVEFIGAPAGHVAGFIERRAVKPAETVRVAAEMPRHPVENDADPGAVALVDEMHQTLRLAEAGRGGEKARRLIAPAAVKRVLRHGQKLEMRVAHVLDVRHERIGKLIPRIKAPVRMPPPRTGVDFINIPRPAERAAAGHPFAVRPVIGERVDARGGAGAHLGRERKGIGLPYNGAVRALDNVLIELSGARARHKAAPYAEIAAAEPVRAVAPRAEIARHANAPRVRRPYGERYAVGLCARAEELLRVEIRPVDPSLFRAVCIQGESPPFLYLSYN